MVVTVAQAGAATDVVFLVEATSNLESAFIEIKNNYVTQILNHFNPTDDTEIAIDVRYE